MGKLILAVLLPPLAVWDRGCGAVLLVGLLTLLLWIPGMLVALFIVLRDMQSQRVPAAPASRGSSIVSTAQSLKNQPLDVNSPRPAPPPSWTESQAAKPANPSEKPDEAQSSPPRPKPPWEE